MLFYVYHIMHIDWLKLCKCIFFLMHQIEEMHIFLITVVIETMDIETKVIFSEIILSNYYTAFSEKILRLFHEETQWQTQLVQL